MDVISIATAAVKVIGPFLPVLMKLGKAAGEKLEDLAETGIKAQAEKLWNKITGRFSDDDELKAAATMVAAKPADDARQKELSDTLAERLGKDDAFAQELLKELGGQQRVQSIIAGNDATINAIYQRMKGPGKQELKAGDRAHISNVTQDME